MTFDWSRVGRLFTFRRARSAGATWLTRKVALGKWAMKPGFAANEVPADTLTSDLRTSANTLSFWEFSADRATFWEQAALAMAAAGDRLDAVGIAWVSRSGLDGQAVRFATSTGQTPVTDLRQSHVDAVGLDAIRLTRIAESIADAVRRKEQRRQLTRLEVAKLLRGAVAAGRLHREELNERLRDSLDATR